MYEINKKRIMDLAGSLAAIIIVFPLMLLIALIICATSSGPALFRQERVGRYGRTFRLLKFRTMSVFEGAEKGRFDLGNNARVTRFGKFLRKSKLDELPQLWNVLKGEMSLVGPRPEVRSWVDAYKERWESILTIRPGITDPASIIFRDEEAILAASVDPQSTYRDLILPGKLELYERYLRERTMTGDLRILAQTFITVLIPGRKKR